VLASPALAANPITNMQSEYLLVTSKNSEDRIYDLGDPTWNTSNSTGYNTGAAWPENGVYNPNDGWVTFGRTQNQNNAYRTYLPDLLANTPTSTSVSTGNMYDTRKMFLGGDGGTWGRYTNTLAIGRYDQVNNVFPDAAAGWYNPGGTEHGQAYGKQFYNGANDGPGGGLYASWHGGGGNGIIRYDWQGTTPGSEWGPGTALALSTSSWTGFHLVIDENGWAYGGPGDNPNVYKIDLNGALGATSDVLVGTVPAHASLGNRVIGNDAGDIAVNTDGSKLYLYGYYSGDGNQNWMGMMDVATGNYTPLHDTGNWLPDLPVPSHHAGKFTYIDLRTGGEEPVVPEPAALGLIGLALLAVRRKRS